jgi:hypothetical protein
MRGSIRLFAVLIAVLAILVSGAQPSANAAGVERMADHWCC